MLKKLDAIADASIDDEHVTHTKLFSAIKKNTTHSTATAGRGPTPGRVQRYLGQGSEIPRCGSIG